MRIISGTAKGRRLASPKGQHIRPVLDQVKEAIFNILFDVRGLDVLDVSEKYFALAGEPTTRNLKAYVNGTAIDREQIYYYIYSNSQIYLTGLANSDDSGSFSIEFTPEAGATTMYFEVQGGPDTSYNPAIPVSAYNHDTRDGFEYLGDTLQLSVMAEDTSWADPGITLNVGSMFKGLKIGGSTRITAAVEGNYQPDTINVGNVISYKIFSIKQNDIEIDKEYNDYYNTYNGDTFTKDIIDILKRGNSTIFIEHITVIRNDNNKKETLYSKLLDIQ